MQITLRSLTTQWSACFVMICSAPPGTSKRRAKRRAASSAATPSSVARACCADASIVSAMKLRYPPAQYKAIPPGAGDAAVSSPSRSRWSNTAASAASGAAGQQLSSAPPPPAFASDRSQRTTSNRMSESGSSCDVACEPLRNSYGARTSTTSQALASCVFTAASTSANVRMPSSGAVTTCGCLRLSLVATRSRSSVVMNPLIGTRPHVTKRRRSDAAGTSAAASTTSTTGWLGSSCVAVHSSARFALEDESGTSWPIGIARQCAKRAIGRRCRCASSSDMRRSSTKGTVGSTTAPGLPTCAMSAKFSCFTSPRRRWKSDIGTPSRLLSSRNRLFASCTGPKRGAFTSPSSAAQKSTSGVTLSSPSGRRGPSTRNRFGVARRTSPRWAAQARSSWWVLLL
mmetsp:Transcript_16906/g.52505  ORF Transcript_16906/g.52505 Transcript_16906/m.52505 type:complete len:400 (+) Transcript_16906:279-1478(+)